ncbi:MAG: SDR family NAD(P)-dependent oxidoreductase [Pseudobdellovibrio sp.]
MRKIALITGSSRGIGQHIALKLSKENYTVIITGRHQTDIDSTCDQIKKNGGVCEAFLGDLTTEEGLKNSLEFVTQKFNQLDVLVTNIGSGKTPNENIVEIAEWKRVFDINFFSAVLAVNTFLPLIEKTQGQIVCIASIAGIEKITAPISYSVAKAAVIAYVQNLMRPLSEKKVRINAVSPGNVWIENGSWYNKMQQDPSRTQGIIQNQVALKKFVEPQEIANAVWFTIENPSMTGQNIVVDAGQTRQT